MNDPEGQEQSTAFAEGMSQLGWNQVSNLHIDYRWAAGDGDRLRAYAAELVALRPDVILLNGTPALNAVRQYTQSIAIVFVNVADPVGSRLVASLARPGGHITGSPSVIRSLVIFNSKNPGHKGPTASHRWSRFIGRHVATTIKELENCATLRVALVWSQPLSWHFGNFQDGIASMIPKNRLEALTDGVYAFAMTLLVIDLRLPESFNPKNDGQLLNALSELGSQLLVYAISFWVLGLRWLGQVQIDNHREKVGHGYGAWSLLGLFFVTCVPFSTMLVGRYGHVAPAVWVYAANMAAGSLIALRLQQLDAPQLTPAERANQRDPALAMIAAALISVAISVVSPDHAMLGYLATLAPVLLRRRQR